MTLQKLSLKHCLIGAEGAIHLAHAITQNSALKELVLACNQLIGNAGAVALVATVSSNPQRLSLCRSGTQGGGDLVDILETGTDGTLQALLFFHNNISSQDKAALALLSKGPKARCISQVRRQSSERAHSFLCSLLGQPSATNPNLLKVC
jgi:hypothetical protein